MNPSFYVILLHLSCLSSLQAHRYSLSFLAQDISCIGNQTICPTRAHCYQTAVETDTQPDANLFNCDINGEKFQFQNISCRPQCHLYLITPTTQTRPISREEHIFISTTTAITIALCSLVINWIGLDVMSVTVTLLISGLLRMAVNKPIVWSSIEGVTISSW